MTHLKQQPIDVPNCNFLSSLHCGNFFDVSLLWDRGDASTYIAKGARLIVRLEAWSGRAGRQDGVGLCVVHIFSFCHDILNETAFLGTEMAQV